MIGERIKTISASMVRSWKSCRRRFFFEYVEEIRPLYTPRPLSFGTAVHAGAEYIFEKIADGTFSISRCELRERILAAYRPEDLELATVEPELAAIAVEELFRQGFVENVLFGRKVVFEKIEHEFEVKCGYAKRLVGKFDGILQVEIEGRLIRLLLELKTATSPDERYYDHLLFDDQATLYVYAANELGHDVRGILYIVLSKPTLRRRLETPEADRKYYVDTKPNREKNRVGKLHEDQRESDESDEEFLERIREWYRGEPRVRLHIVNRNANQLEIAKRDVGAIVRDMTAAEREDTFYPNPNACSILSCSYASICLEDTPEAREGLFVDKARKNEELDSVGF